LLPQTYPAFRATGKTLHQRAFLKYKSPIRTKFYLKTSAIKFIFMYNFPAMKPILLALFCFQSIFGFCQDDDKRTLTVNPLKDDLDLMEKKVLKYENFLPGKLVLKDSSVFEVKMNYHQIFDQLLFISPKGDTLAVKQPETIALVVIGNDSFFHFNKGFLQQATHYPGHNLSFKRTLKYIGKENKGAYGSYSPVSSAVSQPEIAVSDLELQRKMRPDEQLLYVYNVQYFISDRFRNFFPASKKNIFNVFSKNEKELKQYFKENHVNMNKREDLEKLMIFVQGINIVQH
jgi:hypothetical protein